MLGFNGFLILVFVGGFLALMVNGIFVASRGRSIPSTAINQEMFVAQEPIFAEMPKRAVADSHWFVKTFM